MVAAVSQKQPLAVMACYRSIVAIFTQAALLGQLQLQLQFPRQLLIQMAQMFAIIQECLAVSLLPLIWQTLRVLLMLALVAARVPLAHGVA
jgi:hypothetical protein